MNSITLRQAVRRILEEDEIRKAIEGKKQKTMIECFRGAAIKTKMDCEERRELYRLFVWLKTWKNDADKWNELTYSAFGVISFLHRCGKIDNEKEFIDLMDMIENGEFERNEEE